MSSTARPKAGSGANAALRDDDGARRVTVSPELIPALALGPDRAEACLTAAPASADWDAAAKAGAIYDRRRCRLVLFGLGRRAPVRLCETALDALWQAFGGGAEVVEEVLDLVAAAGDPPALVDPDFRVPRLTEEQLPVRLTANGEFLSLVSLRVADGGWQDVVSGHGPSALLSLGPRLLELTDRLLPIDEGRAMIRDSLTRMTSLAEIRSHLVVDAVEQRIELHDRSEGERHVAELGEIWSGWTIEALPEGLGAAFTRQDRELPEDLESIDASGDRQARETLDRIDEVVQALFGPDAEAALADLDDSGVDVDATLDEDSDLEDRLAVMLARLRDQAGDAPPPVSRPW